jgi:integrase
MNTYRELKKKVDSRFLEASKKTDMRFYLLCLLALESGARVSDLLKLEWSNIDTDNNIVSYLNTKSKKVQEQNISDTLVSYIKRFKATLESADELNNSIFYNSYKANVMSRVTANRRSQKEFDINFHQLRKEAGKNIANQSGVVLASAYLGHSKVSTTDIYLKTSQASYLKQMKSILI